MQSQSLRNWNQSHWLVLQTDYFLCCSDSLLLSLMIFFQKLWYSKLHFAYVTVPKGLQSPAAVTLVLLGIMFLVAPVSILMFVVLFVCFIMSITFGYYSCCLYTSVTYLGGRYLVLSIWMIIENTSTTKCIGVFSLSFSDVNTQYEHLCFTFSFSVLMLCAL